jgi:hypothetical protein
MTTTKVKNGQLITSTSTEQDLQPDGVFEDGTVQLIQIELVSGSVQFGVGPAGGSPLLDNTYGTYSTAGGKALRTIDAGNQNLRCVGAGTFIISW